MIHRIRLFHSINGADSYHSWLDTWLTNMSPWENPEVTNELPTLREDLDTGAEYYQTELAFEWTEDRAIILDNLDQYAASYCDWHRIGYHECTHDDDAHVVTESKNLSPGSEVTLDRTPIDGTVTVGPGGYTEPDDYTILSGNSLSLPEDTSIDTGTYDIEYSTIQCKWDEQRENGTVPDYIEDMSPEQ